MAHRRRRSDGGELGLEQVMFEAADPDVFTWYIKNYGIDVNLFVDHSNRLSAIRALADSRDGAFDGAHRQL